MFFLLASSFPSHKVKTESTRNTRSQPFYQYDFCQSETIFSGFKFSTYFEPEKNKKDFLNKV